MGQIDAVRQVYMNTLGLAATLPTARCGTKTSRSCRPRAPPRRGCVTLATWPLISKRESDNHGNGHGSEILHPQEFWIYRAGLRRKEYFSSRGRGPGWR